MPARLINIKYITIRAEKVASPVTALQPSRWTLAHILVEYEFVSITVSFQNFPHGSPEASLGVFHNMLCNNFLSDAAVTYITY